MAKHPLSVAGKIVLQIAVRDIGQLTDLWPTGYGLRARRDLNGMDLTLIGCGLLTRAGSPGRIGS
jgi:hypothetical protein